MGGHPLGGHALEPSTVEMQSLEKNAHAPEESNRFNSCENVPEEPGIIERSEQELLYDVGKLVSSEGKEITAKKKIRRRRISHYKKELIGYLGRGSI